MAVDNACIFLQSAMEIQEKAGGKCADTFVDRCIAFIGEHASECVKSNGFMNLSKDAIVKIISSDFVSDAIHFSINLIFTNFHNFNLALPRRGKRLSCRSRVEQISSWRNATTSTLERRGASTCLQISLAHHSSRSNSPDRQSSVC